MINRFVSLAASAAFLFAAAAHAADPAVTCESGKLKEAGKYGSCRLGAVSKGVKSVTTPDFTKCDTKFSGKWPTIETKGMGMCPSQADQADVAGDVTDFTACMADKLDGQSVGNCFRAVPATGQTTSYGAGDDGDTEPGGTLQYADNGDGTITDANTGLMWEKKILATGGYTTCNNETGTCANPHHARNAYSWGAASAPPYDGKVVTIFLEQLNNRCDQDTTVSCTVDADCSVPGGACGFAGHRDWRLPTLKELQSIVDYSVAYPTPAIGSAFRGGSCGPACTDITDPSCSCTNLDSYYWSSTTYAAYPIYAWFVFFNDGLVGNTDKTSYPMYARAVRGGS